MDYNKTMNERRILLIGGGGYVGSVLTQYLLERGIFVRCLDSLLYENHAAVESFLGHPNYEFVYGDFCDEQLLQKSSDDVSDVVLLAGLVGDPITKKYPQASEKINEAGVQGCFDSLAGKGIDRLIFISTCSNYGLMEGDQLATEESELNPLSLYAKAKVDAEQKLLSLRGEVDYHPTILRFATAFGLSPRMRFDLTVNEFTRELAMGEELLVFDADTWRPYCHVRDFSRLILKVLETEPEKVSFEVFNAGGDANNFTKRGIVEAILEQLPDAKVRYKEHGTDPRNYRVDFRKVRKVLDFEPTYGVPDGISELIAQLKNKVFRNISARTNFFGNYEIQNS
jgi:nucleoside-diphosphate-sugar epimerase